MRRKEALEILERYSNWNFGQKSISLAFNSVRTAEDDIYDQRRKLILKAYETLNNDGFSVVDNDQD